MNQYYYASSESTCGPFTLENLRAQDVTLDTYLCKVGDDTWQRIDRFPELKSLLPFLDQDISNSYTLQENSSAELNSISEAKINSQIFLALILWTTLLFIGIVIRFMMKEMSSVQIAYFVVNRLLFLFIPFLLVRSLKTNVKRRTGLILFFIYTVIQFFSIIIMVINLSNLF